MTTTMTNAALKKLATSLEGRSFLPGDDGYDDARQVWNAMIDRRPAMIARCADVADVIDVVNFAREHRMPVAIRGGGHNVAGHAVCDDGLVIDLSEMKSTNVDVASKTVRIQPGCLVQDLDRETQRFGLATPGGIISTTGMAGLTLGGGFGWISRKHGLSIDNLISVDIVTADGVLVTASADDHDELFWGVRGGGGNFGVVTSFEYRLHDVGPQVYAGLIVRSLESASDYLRFHRQFVSEAPDELSVWLVARKAPPLPFLPEAAHGQPVVVTAFVYLGNPDDGESLVQPLREYGSTLGESVGLHQYTDWQCGFDALNEAGARNYWKSHYLTGLADGAIETVIDFARRLPTADSEIFIPHMAGQIASIPSDTTAYAHRDAPFVLNLHARWQSERDDQRCISWARDFFDAMQAYSTGGVYVNFLSNEGRDRVRAAYPDDTWNRLLALKRQCDPANLFRFNQNISPA